jgi:hypothetical protein
MELNMYMNLLFDDPHFKVLSQWTSNFTDPTSVIALLISSI